MNFHKLTQSSVARAARRALDARRGRRGPARSRPRRAPGIELIGPYADSGFKEPPYIVRRPDGQVVQLSRLLYLVLAEADGDRDSDQLAAAASRRFGRPLSAENVDFLVQTKLRPAGLICQPDGSTIPTRRADPLLALRYRAAVVPPTVVRRASRIFRPLFLPGIVGAALTWLVAFDVWFAQHGLAGALHQLLAHPVLLLALLGLVVVSAVWHELGHATACAYGGATPGAMGLGLYVIWPAFYTDVTDAYRLRRGGRLRTDLGGVYFNALFALGAGGAYFATRFEPLLALVAVQHFQIFQQLMPLMRLDGYYVVNDLVGVPDILSRLRPLLLSLIPFRAADRRVRELKSWVRVVTTTYVVLFLIAATGLLALVAWNAPRFLPTAVHSAVSYSHRASIAWHEHRFTAALLAEVQVLSVLLPAVGLALGAIRLIRKLAGTLARRVPAPMRLAAGLALAAGLGFAVPFFLWGIGSGHPTRYANAASPRHGPRRSRSSKHRTRHHPVPKHSSTPRGAASLPPVAQASVPTRARTSTPASPPASTTTAAAATTTAPAAATTTAPAAATTTARAGGTTSTSSGGTAPSSTTQTQTSGTSTVSSTPTYTNTYTITPANTSTTSP